MDIVYHIKFIFGPKVLNKFYFIFFKLKFGPIINLMPILAKSINKDNPMEEDIDKKPNED